MRRSEHRLGYFARIGTVSIGKSPLRKSKSILCETEAGEWLCEVCFHEEGVILYVAIKYNNESETSSEGGDSKNKLKCYSRRR